MDRVVICMKWGSLYAPDYVNVLYGAVRRNLDGAFRFVCLTDDAAGLRPEVECFPIPDIGLREDLFRIGAWPKISVFSQDLYGLTGRALFIDLDTILCGDIAPFFTQGGRFVAIDEGRWEGRAPSTMSSIFAFDLGTSFPTIWAARWAGRATTGPGTAGASRARRAKAGTGFALPGRALSRG
jgi:hypothetical protein